MRHPSARERREWLSWHDANGQCVRAGMAMKAAQRAHEAREAFERAVTLYRGDYLPDDSYGDWAVMSRERLRDQYLHALEQVATMAMEEQHYPRVIDAAHRLIQVNPCREDMYCLLRGAHGALGQNTRARAWYDVARRTMRAELDRDVSSRTKDVYAPVQGNRLPA